MAKCSKCGTIHDGWSCPICSVKEKLEQTAKEQTGALEDSLREQERMLEEQRESIESAIEDARIEMEYSLREAEAKHKKTTSEAWKLQANSKADRAYELYKAGLYDEVIKLCFEAISQDPGNILPYRYAAWSFEKLGQDIKSRELLKKQINLLKTTDYQNSQGHALKVLQDILEIKNNDDLMQSFLDASKKFDYLPADLLDELMGHSLYEYAVSLYFNNISAGLLSLLGFAYGIELSYKGSLEVGSAGLDVYLKNEPYTERYNIFAAFKGVKESKKFSENTINLIRKEILKRYEEWKPEIQKEFMESAAKEAKIEVDKKSSPKVIGWIVGISSALFLYAPIGSAFEKTHMALPGLIILVGSIATGIFTSRFVRSVKKNNIETELIASMEKKGKEILDAI